MLFNVEQLPWYMQGPGFDLKHNKEKYTLVNIINFCRDLRLKYINDPNFTISKVGK